MKQFRVSVLTPWQTIGLEEWVSGQPYHLTSIKCRQSSGVITDQDEAEKYFNYFGNDDPQVQVQEVQAKDS